MNSFDRHFGWKVFVIRLLYRTLKEKLTIQGHHPFNLRLGFTTTRIMTVYENVMTSGLNQSRSGGKNNLF